MSLGWEICFIQRCKTIILWNGSAFTFPTQFLRCNSRGNLSLHLNYYISYGVILCDKRILLERGMPYTLKSPNKQLVHTFLHFVVSLQNRFYTLALIFVFDVNIYSSSFLSCRKSSTSNQSTIFHFSVVFAVTFTVAH
jgi:hypothetical protein